MCLPLSLAACGGSSSGPQVHGNCTPASATLTLYQGQSFDCSTGTGFTLNGSGTYLVVPQFAAGEVKYDTLTYQIERHGAASSGGSTATVAQFAPLRARSHNERQLRFDATMLAKGHRLARTAAAAATIATQHIAKQTVGSMRNFWVFADTLATTYKQITATLRFVGNHVEVYLDNASPSGGFTALQLQQFGSLTDSVLYVLDTATFAGPTDIDHNGHVIMLLTPAVNALTPTHDCQSEGYVAGYFDPNDLSPQGNQTNSGEVFYGIVPDPGGTVSCAHQVTGSNGVVSVIPGTFLHELQHLISWGQHVLLHGSRDGEEGWLDEGMSIVATELGARHYDSLYTQTGISAYTDSAQSYIIEQFFDSYDYLHRSDTASLTLHSDADCCLEWRGGDWLLLRYIGDQFGSSAYHNMEVSTSTGTPNIAQATGQTFATTFGNFGIASYTDSLPDVARGSIPAQFRFNSWPFRFNYVQLNGAFPISPSTLTSSSVTTATLVPGTSAYYQITIPNGTSAVTLVFGSKSGAFQSSFHPQVMVFRTQ